MAKPNQKLSVENIIIDEIDKNSSNDWDKLCDVCSSLIKDVKMTDEEIDKIVDASKNGDI